MIRLTQILLVIFSCNCYGQGFEGVITYEINHDYLDSSFENKLMPSKMDFYISGEMARVDQHTRIGIQSTLIDTITKKHMLLIQLMDKKFGIVIKEDSNEIEKISYSQNKKKILDFNCFKAIINEENSTSTIYYTKQISKSYNNNFKNLNGFPLYYEIISPKFISSYSAIEINDTIVDPILFEIDKNTSIYTMKEFQELMTQ